MAPEVILHEAREPSDLRPRIIVAVGLGTLAFVGVTLGIIWLFEDLFGSGRQPNVAASQFPPPQLQSDPADDLQRYRAAQRTELEGYAWADRDRGLVRVPITRAMEMTAGRGSAAYEPLDPPHIPDPRR
jgi:hypothetical protein